LSKKRVNNLRLHAVKLRRLLIRLFMLLDLRMPVSQPVCEKGFFNIKKGVLPLKHIISVEEMSKQEIMDILQLAVKLRDQPSTFQKQLFAANLFFEPSTRTKMSF